MMLYQPSTANELCMHTHTVFITDIQACYYMDCVHSLSLSFLFLSCCSPKEYELGDLIQHFFGVMYRPCRMVAPPHWVYNMVAYLLELNPFIPYMTRDMMKRVRHR